LGKRLASYRKIHLFDVDLANGVSARESDTRAFGDGIVVAKTELCDMGLSVCYDLRFPELYRTRRQRRPADFVPSPSPLTRAKRTETLHVRAIENQVYVIAPDHPAKARKASKPMAIR
jgi:predicted amidohydrolase